jgi:hypothetical protein
MAMTHRAMLRQVLAAQDAQAAELQLLINEGQWSFEGSIGRAMMQAINEGRCVLGPEPAWDYWGNRIPSRYEVKPTTKGGIPYAYKALTYAENRYDMEHWDEPMDGPEDDEPYDDDFDELDDEADDCALASPDEEEEE